MISSQAELEEAIRQYELNKDSEIKIHGNVVDCFFFENDVLIFFVLLIVFPNVPFPGLPCIGEDSKLSN